MNQLSSALLAKRDQQEVAGYFETLDTIAENFAVIPITINQLKGLHKMRLTYVEKNTWHCGAYKQASNAIAATLQ